MSLLSNTSIRRKVLIPPLILVLCLCVVAAVGINGLYTQHRAVDAIHTISLERTALINGFMALSEQVQADVLRLSVLRRSERQDDIQAIRTRLAQESRQLDLLYQKVLSDWEHDMAGQVLLGELKTSMVAFQHLVRHVADATLAEPDADQSILLATTTASDALRSSLGEYLSYQQSQIEHTETVSHDRAVGLVIIIAGFTIIVGITGIIVSGLVSSRGISLPIQRITELMCQLAEGDTSIVVEGRERRDEIGAMAQAIHVFQGNTAEKHRAEEALRENQRMLTTLMSNLPGIVYRCQNDHEWTMEFLSEGCLALTGHPPEELIDNRKLSYSDIILPEDRSMVWDDIQQALEVRQPFHISYRIRTAGGQTKWVGEQGVGLWAADDRLIALEGFITDVTEAKEAESALRQYAQRLSALRELDQGILRARSSEAIAQTALRHIREIIGCQRASVITLRPGSELAEILAVDVAGDSILTPGAPLPRDFMDGIRTFEQGRHIVIPDIVEADPPLAIQEQLLAEGIRSYIGMPMVYQDTLIGALYLGATRPDMFGLAQVELARDVTDVLAIALHQADLHEQIAQHADELEQRVAERTEELRERMAEIEQLNRAITNVLEDFQITNRNLEAATAKLGEVNLELSHFAYVVSHDLKAPLRGITQLTQWLSDDYGPAFDDDGREMITLLMGRTKRMYRLIEGILEYSRVGRVHERERRVDLNQLVAEILQMSTPPPHVSITVEDELPTVVGERTRLSQVFQNLLSNAVKFMDKPQGEVKIHCAEAGEHWLVSVADNGPGIETKHQNTVFHLFETLVPRDRVENTGIGLAIVKRIVDSWGGRVWVDSTVGSGSTFFFTIPKAEAGQETA